jgi:hypothetical protein
MRKSLLAVVLTLAPRAAFACPVCFGQNDSPLASAMNMGIFAMLGVVAAVLAAFATFFVHLMRRARLAAAAPDLAGAGESGATPAFGSTECGRFAPDTPNA